MMSVKNKYCDFYLSHYNCAVQLASVNPKMELFLLNVIQNHCNFLIKHYTSLEL